jgi:hypothetical protein
MFFSAWILVKNMSEGVLIYEIVQSVISYIWREQNK